MSRRLLIDGDSLAKAPGSGRLSIARLDSAVGFLRREIAGAQVRVTLVVSYEFGQAMTSAQRARLDRLTAGTFQMLPAGVHLRDFIVRGADDGQAIVLSNNAFTRQRDSFPWLTEAGSGRHVLGRRADNQSEWTFVEARPAGGARRTLGEIVGSHTRAEHSLSETATPAVDPVTDLGLDEAPTGESQEGSTSSVNSHDTKTAGSDEDHAETLEEDSESRIPDDGDGTPEVKTVRDLFTLFGVEESYVLALVNRGQGPNVSHPDELLPDRTVQRVKRLLRDDVNRYQRNISDVTRIRKIDMEEVRRRARNLHIPLALRPDGDRTTSEGFARLLYGCSSYEEKFTSVEYITDLAARFEVDPEYVLAMARSHGGQDYTGASVLPSNVYYVVCQELEAELYPFSRKLSRAAELLGIDPKTLQAMANSLGITMATRPDGLRLTGGDYFHLAVAAWPQREQHQILSPPTTEVDPSSAPQSSSTTTGGERNSKGATLSQKSTSKPSAETKPDQARRNLWKRTPFSRPKS